MSTEKQEETNKRGKVTISNIHLLHDDKANAIVINKYLSAAGCLVKYKAPGYSWTKAEHKLSDAITIWWLKN